ncbi:hypothetical protein [Henriciella algicola]|uniref:Uncharacterized protein n=1 Tax=Henriciella algicola TaxID=1608422 RepID=A0A399REY9_9PROT|nr:hypothetical protein [Henriciella algicola]RIJ29213.1 hypothetical protein D1222_12745 [Henriciella algicola]
MPRSIPNATPAQIDGARYPRQPAYAAADKFPDALTAMPHLGDRALEGSLAELGLEPTSPNAASITSRIQDILDEVITDTIQVREITPSRATRREELGRWLWNRSEPSPLSFASESELADRLILRGAIPMRGTLNPFEIGDYDPADVRAAAADLHTELSGKKGADARLDAQHLVTRLVELFEDVTGEIATHSTGTDSWHHNKKSVPQSKAGQFILAVRDASKLGIPDHTLSTALATYIRKRNRDPA